MIKRVWSTSGMNGAAQLPQERRKSGLGGCALRIRKPTELGVWTGPWTVPFTVLHRTQSVDFEAKCFNSCNHCDPVKRLFHLSLLILSSRQIRNCLWIESPIRKSSPADNISCADVLSRVRNENFSNLVGGLGTRLG